MAGQPITAQHLKVDTMTPVLHELGFRHLKGENRHIYAETPGKTWLTADKIRYGKTGRGAR
ncbi:hypothetical protein F443_11236 [Phytophthora nicotianae P1569]|uniref:Uncharacterized protein n=2 Tax=Phytophthora nicotianae TaxID=4792 RepID=V9EXM5_PHYNI|nr:hypothetical protein F443_11236 [Phytophthora nicotianae P1569]